jgi:hypothetical protein
MSLNANHGLKAAPAAFTLKKKNLALTPYGCTLSTILLAATESLNTKKHLLKLITG